MKPDNFFSLLFTLILTITIGLSSTAMAETYSYDNTGRLIGVVYDDGSGINYTYDANGNRTQLALLDTVAPVITLNGVSPVTIEAGTTYTDMLATVTDNIDATNNALAGISTVNTGVPGSYTVTYNYTDVAGNAAIQVVRTVNVVDTTAPVITLNGVSPVTIEAGTVYADSLAVVTDNVDATNNALAGISTVNTGVPGSYTVTYNYTDVAGNAAVQVVRTVNVVDTTAPVITVPANITVAATSTKGIDIADVAVAAFLAGATATDNVAVTGIVHDAPTIFLVGDTVVTFTASDAATNSSAGTAIVTVTPFVAATPPPAAGGGGGGGCIALVSTRAQFFMLLPMLGLLWLGITFKGRRV